MSTVETMSSRPALRFWGWGYDNENLSAEENKLIETMVGVLAPDNTAEISPP